MCLEMSSRICASSSQSCPCSWLLLNELNVAESRSLCRRGRVGPAGFYSRGNHLFMLYVFLWRCVLFTCVFVYTDWCSKLFSRWGKQRYRHSRALFLWMEGHCTVQCFVKWVMHSVQRLCGGTLSVFSHSPRHMVHRIMNNITYTHCCP